ncbi:MAG: plasmid maintenance system killer family protein [Cyanobacteria bacterium QH_6_48_35]|jgi:proteic killer suppression protein|nr:MAG: plasmid maintenance system killer family protein [Cyanobacteria bacterium QH_10_48_56]PSO57264.1 MAG: plasmid maintenance system killer family protein [Cyanobacteria bacterium QH_7_48_89]PSO62118.1 MAG: plasmid maintenance system killer family protein [Cyanobacteria bacterium QH_6_48_35]PSO79586.1 MAG: plasmid maintenance system killer family protein [Cyanobacteria bacterium QH_9_48_43]PSO91687.1 MAG: plasmid maintenance system killer family protein [Cyanobacteria bacterium QS_3_48_167]
MIRSAGDKRTKRFLEGDRVKECEQISRKAQLLLRQLNRAKTLQDVSSPRYNRLHQLKGELKEFYSLSIDKQYRIIFRWDSENGDAHDVGITDYH